MRYFTVFVVAALCGCSGSNAFKDLIVDQQREVGDCVALFTDRQPERWEVKTPETVYKITEVGIRKCLVRAHSNHYNVQYDSEINYCKRSYFYKVECPKQLEKDEI
jgi:hypothetical protein